MKKRVCLPCPSNCDRCYNSTLCTVCQFGFSPSSNGSCIQCPLDCNGCDANNVTNCLACRNGFELVTINGKKQCQKCPAFCEKCANGICQQPRAGYSLDTQKNLCYEECRSPCNTCSPANSSLCTSCIPGYKLNGSVCSGDLSCNDNLTCLSCPAGNMLIARKCYPCVLGPNCTECHSDDPKVCVFCA